VTLVPPVASEDTALTVATTARGRKLALWLVVLAALALTTSSVLTTDADWVSSVLSFVGAQAARLSALRWPFVAIVVALAVTHYAAATVSLRAASGVRSAFGETMLVQFAAATANRLTIGGIGAAATNARYLSRRGLTATTSVGAVTAMGLFGGTAKTLVLTALVFCGAWLGFGGGTAQVTALRHHLTGFTGPLHSPWTFVGVAAALLVAATWIAIRRRRGKRIADIRQLWRPAVDLLKHPRRLALTMGCSAVTTLALGLAFAAATAALPGTHASVGVGGLLVAYMLGGVAGSATPLPAGIGATEAALTALLVADHIPASQALQIVLLFRVLTFWLPALVGLPVMRYLIRRHAL
jgi:uncharacterized membrane protein YbhN (UPF0104 family)